MKPRKIRLVVEYELSTYGFDDDVDWSDVDKVIRDQIDCTDLAEEVYDCPWEIKLVEWKEINK